MCVALQVLVINVRNGESNEHSSSKNVCMEIALDQLEA